MNSWNPYRLATLFVAVVALVIGFWIIPAQAPPPGSCSPWPACRNGGDGDDGGGTQVTWCVEVEGETMKTDTFDGCGVSGTGIEFTTIIHNRDIVDGGADLTLVDGGGTGCATDGGLPNAGSRICFRDMFVDWIDHTHRVSCSSENWSCAGDFDEGDPSSSCMEGNSHPPNVITIPAGDWDLRWNDNTLGFGFVSSYDAASSDDNRLVMGGEIISGFTTPPIGCGDETVATIGRLSNWASSSAKNNCTTGWIPCISDPADLGDPSNTQLLCDSDPVGDPTPRPPDAQFAVNATVTVTVIAPCP